MYRQIVRSLRIFIGGCSILAAFLAGESMSLAGEKDSRDASVQKERPVDASKVDDVRVSEKSKSKKNKSEKSIEDAGPESTPKPLPRDVYDKLDNELRAIEFLRDEQTSLQKGIKTKSVLLKRLIKSRGNRNRLEILKRVLKFSTSLIDERDQGRDVSAFHEKTVEILKDVVAKMHSTIEMSARDEVIGSDEEKMSALEQAAVDARLVADTLQMDQILQLLIDSLPILKKFGLEVESEERLIKKNLALTAQMRSVYLEITIEMASLLTDQVEQLPEDTELTARLRITGKRVDFIIEALQRAVTMMTAMDMDVARYKTQLMETSGKISADILDAKVFKGLIARWYGSISSWFQENGLKFFFQAIFFVFILIGFLFLSRFVQKIVHGALASSNLNFSRLLSRMIVSVTRNLIILIGLLVALSQVGISVGPVLAGLGVAGFILGFALQDILSNFASGMMILFYHPFDIGDILEAGGVFGRVHKMSLVNTTVLTFDNQTLVVPNNKIWGDVIKNVTAQSVRRVDMVFGISYTDDIPKAERVLLEVVKSCDKVLSEPEPMIHLHELGDSSVNFVVRPWVKTEDYWDVYWEIHRSVKLSFDQNDISIPFPQRDVHLYREEPASEEKPGPENAQP